MSQMPQGQTHLSQCIQRALAQTKTGVCLVPTHQISAQALHQELTERWSQSDISNRQVAALDMFREQIGTTVQEFALPSKSYLDPLAWAQAVQTYDKLTEGSLRLLPSQLKEWGIENAKLLPLLEYEHDVASQVRFALVNGAKAILVSMPQQSEAAKVYEQHVSSTKGTYEGIKQLVDGVKMPPQVQALTHSVGLQMQVITQVVDQCNKKVEHSGGNRIGLLIESPERSNVLKMMDGQALGWYADALQKMPERLTVGVERISMDQADWVLWAKKSTVGLNEKLAQYLEEYHDVMEGVFDGRWGSANDWWKLNELLQQGQKNGWDNERLWEEFAHLKGFLDSPVGQDIVQTYFAQDAHVEQTHQALARFRALKSSSQVAEQDHSVQASGPKAPKA